jgi:hypothetical protein
VNEIGVLAGLREVMRVDRAQRAVVRRARVVDPRPAWRRPLDAAGAFAFMNAMPALVVFASWRGAGAAGFELWDIAAVLGVLGGSGLWFQYEALRFSARQVLLLPGKGSVLLHRLLRMVPRFALIGAAWAAACFLRLHSSLAGQPLLLASVCTVAALAPLAWNVGALLGRLVAPGASGSLLQIALLSLLARWGTDPASWSATDWLDRAVQGFVLLIGFACVASLAYAWWRQPRLQARALVAEFVRLPRLCVVLLLWPSAPWLVTQGAIAPIALAGAASLALLPFSLPRLLAAVRGAEAVTRGGAVSRGDELGADDARERRIAPAATFVHRGRSPWRAAWRVYWVRDGVRWRELLTGRRLPGTLFGCVMMLVRNLGGFWLLGMALLRDETTAVGMAITAALFAPAFVADAASTRVYLWGVDWRLQARQHLLAVLALAALPLLAFGVAAVTALGWSEPRALVLGAAAATILLRAGWRGLRPGGELEHFGGGLALAIVVLLLATIWLRVAQWWTVGPALALGVAAVALRIARWREPELVAARVVAHERAGGPAAD